MKNKFDRELFVRLAESHGYAVEFDSLTPGIQESGSFTSWEDIQQDLKSRLDNAKRSEEF